MKKVGIVSFHVAINYGVYLQAYALQRKIEELGYEPEIVDYRKRTDETDGRIKRALRRIMKEHMSPKEIVRDVRAVLRGRKLSGVQEISHRKKAFWDFADKHFKLTRFYENYQSICQDHAEYDACVCGSDQIWNPLYTKCNPVYFLEFVPPEKRIAYAPSIAIQKIPDEYTKALESKIGQFAAVSLRERSASELWAGKLKRDVYNVVDPTLLYSGREWKEMAVMPKEEHYVLCYFLGHDEAYLKLIRRIEEKYHLKAVILPFAYEAIMKYPGIKAYASIEEFLGYICNADFVLTDSFHGTAFSVNFNRNFYVIKRADKGGQMHSRIHDFLENIGLEDRELQVEDAGSVALETIDYAPVNVKLDKWIQDSVNYLDTSLKKVVKA